MKKRIYDNLYLILNKESDVYLIRLVNVFSVHVPGAVHRTFKTIPIYTCDTMVDDLLENGCCSYGYTIAFSTQLPLAADCLF